VAKAAGIGLGTPVHITADKGRIVLEPVRYNLKSLLSGVTQKNHHPAIDTDSAVGEEAW